MKKDTLFKLFNYSEVARRITPTATHKYLCKWSNTSFAVNLHGNTSDIEDDSTAIQSYIGYGNSIIGMDTYNLIANKVKEINAQYYSTTDAGFNQIETEAICALVQNSLVMYAMLCTTWRAQSGYLIKDEDGVYMGPVLFNHDQKYTNSSDWAVGGSTSFAEIILQSSFATQNDIQTSGQVYGTWSVGNEPWANMVANVLNNIYLPERFKEMCEHLFTTVFSDPDADYNASFVTFFPTSGMNTYAGTYDANNALESLVATARSLTSYDKYNDANGFADADNGTSWNDFLTYIENFTEYSTEMFNIFPQLDTILADLQITRGSKFDFTRSLTHDTVLFIKEENVSDFVMSTAVLPSSGVGADCNSSIEDLVMMCPVITRDHEVSKYKDGILSYEDMIEINYDRSYELALQGKIIPLRFAYFQRDDNNVIGKYIYQYSVAVVLDSALNADYLKNATLINSELVDFGCVEPVFVRIQDTMDATITATTVDMRLSNHEFYKNPENIGLLTQYALDTFWNIKED